MLHLDDSITGNSTDMTVLQRHQAIFGCQHEDQRQDNNAIESYAMPRLQSLVGDDSMVYQELMSRSMNADQYLGSMFPAFRELQLAGTEFVGDTISIAPLQLVTSSSPEVNHSFSVGLNLKKRKADELIVEECCNDDEIGVEVRQGESAAIETTNLETSTDNSKVSDVRKPDYIHVRARRGQATDSHSLAERARREKINKKMKCLQDLVPGCSKVTGKAGMLDEIINYVQSLQRQIEFLSMKLAALNPRLDFDMHRFSMEEFPAHVTSFPAAVAPPEMADSAYQFSQAQKGAAAYGIDMPINPMQLAPQRSTTSSSSLSIPKQLNPSQLGKLINSLFTTLSSIEKGQLYYYESPLLTGTSHGWLQPEDGVAIFG